MPHSYPVAEPGVTALPWWKGSGRRVALRPPAPLRTVLETFTSHGSSRPLTAYYGPRKRRLLFAANLTEPMAFPPRSGVVGGPFAIPGAVPWHASNFSPQLASISGVTWMAHQAHVSTLSGRVYTLSGRLWIPVAFRLPAFASWAFPFPLRNSAFLAVGLLVECRDLLVPSSPDPIGLTPFLAVELRSGWVSFLLRELGVRPSADGVRWP